MFLFVSFFVRFSAASYFSNVRDHSLHLQHSEILLNSETKRWPRSVARKMPSLQSGTGRLARFRGRFFCTGIHRFPQLFSEIPLANFSRCSYYAHQIDREEKLLESIRRGGKDKTWSAS